MTVPPAAPSAPRRRVLPIVLGGCAVLALCVVFACVANAAYWTVARRTVRPASEPEPEAVESGFDSLPSGNAQAGEDVFTSNGCAGCHSLEPGDDRVGPSLAGLADRAGDRRPDYTAEMYIYESIVEPGAYTVDGFPSGMMPSGFGGSLSTQEMADLVAFLKAQ